MFWIEQKFTITNGATVEEEKRSDVKCSIKMDSIDLLWSRLFVFHIYIFFLYLFSC